jgi:hypothetical protein
MKVRCVADHPNTDQVQTLESARLAFPGQQYGVTKNKEYYVYGVHTFNGIPHVYVNLRSADSPQLVSVPLLLFEVIDGHVSRSWEVRHWPDGDLTLWPPPLYEDFFAESVSDGIPEYFEKFDRLRKVIETEAEIDSLFSSL